MVGVFLGRFRKEEPEAYEKNFQELLQMYSDGKIRPIVTQTYPFEDFEAAFKVFKERRVMGKVTLTIRQE